jgi:SOS-response transcriptional repressor LexA
MRESSNPTTTVVKNLQRLMSKARISQSELAKQTGVNQPTIHRILSGKNPYPRQETIAALAAFFEVAVDDFRYRDLSDQSLLPVNLRGFRIPMTSAKRAGLPYDKKPPQRSGESIVVYHEVSDESFAFPVADRAMEPRFNVDDVVVVDPERQSGHGNFVAARVEGMEEAVVRQYYRADNGPAKLVALNRQQYPDITANAGVRILGRVVLRMEKVL